MRAIVCHGTRCVSYKFAFYVCHRDVHWCILGVLMCTIQMCLCVPMCGIEMGVCVRMCALYGTQYVSVQLFVGCAVGMAHAAVCVS